MGFSLVSAVRNLLLRRVLYAGTLLAITLGLLGWGTIWILQGSRSMHQKVVENRDGGITSREGQSRLKKALSGMPFDVTLNGVILQDVSSGTESSSYIEASKATPREAWSQLEFQDAKIKVSAADPSKPGPLINAGVATLNFETSEVQLERVDVTASGLDSTMVPSLSKEDTLTLYIRADRGKLSLKSRDLNLDKGSSPVVVCAATKSLNLGEIEEKMLANWREKRSARGEQSKDATVEKRVLWQKERLTEGELLRIVADSFDYLPSEDAIRFKSAMLISPEMKNRSKEIVTDMTFSKIQFITEPR